MIVIGIMALLMAIAIPNYIAYRHKTYCTQAESDADHIASAIADYFGTAARTGLPAMSDVKVATLNHAEIIGADPNVHITIQVTDRTRRCPLEYQNGTPGWDLNCTFNKEIR